MERILLPKMITHTRRRHGCQFPEQSTIQTGHSVSPVKKMRSTNSWDTWTIKLGDKTATKAKGKFTQFRIANTPLIASTHMKRSNNEAMNWIFENSDISELKRQGITTKRSAMKTSSTNHFDRLTKGEKSMQKRHYIPLDLIICSCHAAKTTVEYNEAATVTIRDKPFQGASRSLEPRCTKHTDAHTHHDNNLTLEHSRETGVSMPLLPNDE